MKSMSSYGSAKQAAIVKELLHTLKQESKQEDKPQMPLMFTESSVPARNLIRKLIAEKEAGKKRK